MWRGSITFETPLVWSIGFLITFVFGGLTGVILASPPLDFHVSDTYFVVAHFHYVVFGTVVFAMFAGFYFWWPKWTGKMLNESLGKWHFWLLFIGFHTTFLIQHWLGVVAMPRRYYSYLPEDNITWMNQLSTIGAGILAVSMIPFFLNVYITARRARRSRSTTRGATVAPSSGPRAARPPRLHHVDPAYPLGGAGIRPQSPRSGHPGGHRSGEGCAAGTGLRRGDEGSQVNARQCHPVLDPRRILRLLGGVVRRVVRARRAAGSAWSPPAPSP